MAKVLLANPRIDSESLTTQLAGSGHMVIPLGTANTLHKMVEESHPDVIVTDVMGDIRKINELCHVVDGHPGKKPVVVISTPNGYWAAFIFDPQDGYIHLTPAVGDLATVLKNILQESLNLPR